MVKITIKQTFPVFLQTAVLGSGEIQVRVGQNPCPSDALGIGLTVNSGKKLMICALRSGEAVWTSWRSTKAHPVVGSQERR